ncbi:MAG: class I SAM-dependent methyltransferase [Planctomycetaceae bacterium]|nr:class I SAM-dependent methyltransferase [Planctomycetaceae bacterium]
MRLASIGLILLLAGTMVPPATVADEPAASTPAGRYKRRREHDPHGIGKFYFDREIARVMGHQGIAWLERPEREQEERLTLLVDSLGLEPGMVVADIGAGSGVISAMIADRIGADGTVLAVDIQQEMLDALADRCRASGITNITPVLGTVKSPKLDDESVDLAIMVDVYHEFNFPYEMLLAISKSLKPGGRVAFVEYRKEDPQVPILDVHKMSEAQVKLEVDQPEFGLAWKETIDRLPRQHVVVFEKKPAE